MVLVAGIPSEPPVKLLLDSLESLNIPFVMLNQRMLKNASLNWELEGEAASGILQYNKKEYALEDFTGVYIRFMDERELPELKSLQPDDELVVHFQHFQTSLTNWMEVAGCNVVNRYSAMASNNSKPYQAILIAQVGLKVPETLITNQPDEAGNFVKLHKNVIYKSISGARSIVKKFSGEDTGRLHKIKFCPVQFQKLVNGFDVRVHVIGETTTATRIESSGTDYRYNTPEEGYTILTPYELPQEIHYQCVELAKQLSLDFCGIDLRFSNENKNTPWCFEVNPCPGYSYYQNNTGQNISEILAAYLGNHNYYYQKSLGIT